MKADHRNILRVAFQSLNTGLVLVIPDLHQPLNSKGQDHIRNQGPIFVKSRWKRKKKEEKRKKKRKRKKKKKKKQTCHLIQ